MYVYMYVFFIIGQRNNKIKRKKGRVQIMNVIRVSTTVQYFTYRIHFLSGNNFAGVFFLLTSVDLSCGSDMNMEIET